jgi:beta-N-acetylhexosaminidase
VPALAKNRSPATISNKLLTGVLRNELDFDGLILTDELEGMRAISNYGVDRAAVAAINAGADMVFVAFSADVQRQVHRALIEAVRSGQISKARLEQALTHIVRLKTKRQLFDAIEPRSERLAILSRHTGEGIAREIAQKSITQIGPSIDCLPIEPNSRIVLVTDSQNFAQAIRARAPQAKVLMVDSKSAPNLQSAEQSVRELTANSDAVIAAFIRQDRFEVVRSCFDASRPLVLILLNVPGPNFLQAIPKAQAVLINYSYQPVSAEATADVLFKDPITPGILPIQLKPNDSPAQRVSSR